MIKTSSHLNILLSFVALLIAGPALGEWDNPADIPVIMPVSVGIAGEQPADIVRYLMAEGATAAAPSPDGKQVAFRWSVSGEPQLWLVDATGGWPVQLTFGTGITFFEWSPAGGQLLIGRDTQGNEREGFYLLSVDGRNEHLVLPLSDAFRQFGTFSADGERILYASTERNGRDFDIYVADVASGKARLVYEGDFGFYPNAWQPGGNLVICSEVRGEDGNDVHLLDINSGEMKPLFQPEISASFSDYQWLPDGSGFYLASNVDHEYIGLAFFSLADGAFSFIETPDHDVENLRLSSDGRYLSWTTNEDGYSVLHALDRSSDKPLKTPVLPAGIYGTRFADSAPVLSILVNGVSSPGDVYTWDLNSGALAQPVHSSLAGLNPDQFVAPKSLRYKAQDGVELQGLLYQPDPGVYPGKRPLVVQVHGGPTGQSRPGFRQSTQYLVNKGIAVFDVNVRGSTGFGKTYARLDNQEKRLDSVRDLIDTVEFLSNDINLDTSRAAVMGGSYGGYMVNAVLGAYPGVFSAGVSVVGVSDWVRALQEASPALKASDRIEYGDIREERWQEFYSENSPINNAGKINVPLLVSHGANDPRDPVTESDRIVNEVRDNGFEVTYLRFPDEGHGIRKRANRVAYYREVADFLERNLAASHQEEDADP